MAKFVNKFYLLELTLTISEKPSSATKFMIRMMCLPEQEIETLTVILKGEVEKNR